VEIHDLLNPSSVVFGLRAGSKKQVLQELARIAAGQVGLHERVVFDVLLERERLGSTGVGEGVAIPHGRIADLTGLSGVFALLKQPVDFDALDGRPVDLVFLLLAPQSAGADHLKALSRISRLMRDRDMRDKLRGARSNDALYALLTTGSTSEAA
jgi:PTS system nitrogen regulatory IIA component